MSKRPDKVHYIPPGRRKTSAVSATPVIPPLPPPPPLGPTFMNSSTATRVTTTTTTTNTIGSPASSHAHLVSPHARFEPSTTPPLRNTVDPMRSQHSTPHGRLQGQRRDSYQAGLSPGPIHRVELREHGGLRPADAFYRDNVPVFESPRMPSVVAAGKYHPPLQPAHLSRNRNYEDRYKEIPPPFRSKAAPPPGWMDGLVGKHNPSPMMASPSQPTIRILRNPDRERERERENRGDFVDEHVTQTRSFNLTPQQEKPRPTYAVGLGPGKAQFIGDNIHSLAPSTSIGERVRKFISTLHPDRPDPPAQDEPYEYPYTQPCDPSTVPIIKHGRNFPMPLVNRPGWMPENVRIPASGEQGYFGPQPKSKPQEKRRRHRTRTRRPEWEEGSSGEDCARRLYRLHT